MAKKKKAAEEEDEGGKGKRKGKMIAVGLVGIAALYKFVLAPAPAEEAVDAIDEQAERVIEEGDIFPMEELVVNLTDRDDSRYLRVGLALVLEAGTSPDSMETEAPIAIDAAIDYLSAQSFADLREPGSKSEIRDELSARIRAAYGDEKVVRVLLTTFVMQ
jgi:flagellar basal body-associated protein FliL